MDDDKVERWLKSQEKAPRRQISALSKQLDEDLQVDAWIHGRSIGGQATILLGKALKDRTDYREKMLAKRAESLGLSIAATRHYAITGKLPPLTEEEQERLLERIAQMQGEEDGE